MIKAKVNNRLVYLSTTLLVLYLLPVISGLQDRRFCDGAGLCNDEIDESRFYSDKRVDRLDQDQEKRLLLFNRVSAERDASEAAMRDTSRATDRRIDTRERREEKSSNWIENRRTDREHERETDRHERRFVTNDRRDREERKRERGNVDRLESGKQADDGRRGVNTSERREARNQINRRVSQAERRERVDEGRVTRNDDRMEDREESRERVNERETRLLVTNRETRDTRIEPSERRSHETRMDERRSSSKGRDSSEHREYRERSADRVATGQLLTKDNNPSPLMWNMVQAALIAYIGLQLIKRSQQNGDWKPTSFGKLVSFRKAEVTNQ